MAKKESVFYQLPIEELHGKLATKQKGILYAGQRPPMTPYDLGTGKHEATNYRKFIVLTNRRGKNRFYVKSNTTFTMSRKTKLQQTVLALGASYARHLWEYISSGDVTYSDVYDALLYYAGDSVTPVELLTGIVMQAIRLKSASITMDSVPDAEGLTEKLTVGANPFNAPDNVYSQNVYDENYTVKADEQKIMQRFFPALNDIILGEDLVPVTIETADLRERDIRLFVPQGATAEQVFATIYGHAYANFPGELPQATMTIWAEDGRIWAAGTLYTNEERTTALAKNTVITEGMTLYIG